MCKFCFNSGHKDLETKLASSERTLKRVSAELKTCQSGQGDDVKALRARVLELEPPAPPSAFWPLTSDQLAAMLRDLVGPDIEIWLSDRIYHAVEYTEFLRFVDHVKVYLLHYVPELLDCNAFTRKLKGELVCVGWSALPSIDVWYESPRGGHSEMLTVLVDDRVAERPTGLFLAEPQSSNLVRKAEGVLLKDGATLVYNLND